MLLCVFVRVCVCMRACMRACMSMCVCIYVCMHTHMHTHICVSCIHVCMGKCIHARVYTLMKSLKNLQKILCVLCWTSLSKMGCHFSKLYFFLGSTL